MRILSFFFIATSILLTLPTISSRSPGGATVPPACLEGHDLRPVTLEVPANGRASFSIEDLVARSTGIGGCEDLAAAGITVEVDEAGRGSLSVAGSDRGTLAYIPQHGFSGVSSLWSLVLRDDTGAVIGQIRVNFEVRNSLPVAADDAIVVPVEVSRLDVGPAMGVLANDTDDNGDRLVVYSQGGTEFPWGSVSIQSDGSYRIVVTDHELLGPAQVRYVVWDQQGSPTSVDYGVLAVDFEDAVVAGD